MGLGFAVFAGTTPEIIRASARETERLGYSSFWVNHPGSTDGLAALAQAARETQRIELGDGVLFNWLTPEYARLSAERVREGAAAARRQPPKLFAYVRVALGPAAGDRLQEEANRYAAIPAYGANFTRMGLKPVETTIAAENRDAVRRGLAKWQGAVDEVVIRAITAKDTVEDHLALVRAAAPA